MSELAETAEMTQVREQEAQKAQKTRIVKLEPGQPYCEELLRLLYLIATPDPVDTHKARSVGGFLSSTRSSNSQLEPEAKLMLAIIEEALKNVLSDGAVAEHIFTSRESTLCANRKRKQEALSYFFDEDPAEAEHPFTFVNICETLGLSVSYLRKGLRELFWREWWEYVPARRRGKGIKLFEGITERRKVSSTSL